MEGISAWVFIGSVGDQFYLIKCRIRVQYKQYSIISEYRQYDMHHCTCGDEGSEEGEEDDLDAPRDEVPHRRDHVPLWNHP